MNEAVKTLIHRLTPKYLLTRLAGVLARNELGGLTTWAITQFIKKYKIDMSEALKEKPEEYKTFNEFFTRDLKDGARPVCPEESRLCMPVDGTVAEFGDITYGRIVAAKGQDYSFRSLIGGDDNDAAAFNDGKFICIYLSPANYHCIHMPVDGTLRKMVFVPGKYYSVNPTYVKTISELFTKNERAVCLFDTPAGPMAMVLVGATIVGSISTEWHGEVSPNRLREVTVWDYSDQNITLNKGDRMGKFYLGSTVILLFGRDAVSFVEGIESGKAVKFGEPLADIGSEKNETENG
ncbi:archaetidylserine decarboxylase [Ruminobacter sp.]|jgi:phosphatidylserine decarboxylase|uniref:archaetidylserine decarboxylase n=1 Tax=Ruminobacter sp. TaxID=2774296 RepID=UPI00386F80DB